MQRPLQRLQLALQAQRPQPLTTSRPLQLLQACMKQPRPKLQMQMQMKGSQPLIRSGAVGLEIAISSRRADEIGDDVSG